MEEKCFKCGAGIIGPYIWCKISYSEKTHLDYGGIYICYTCGKRLVE